MVELDRDTINALESMHVRIDVPDGDTVILRGVPTNPAFYSKDATNLLIKRPRRSMPFMICVDEDLEYSGDDPQLVRMFARGVKRRGWRTLYMGRAASDDLGRLTQDALALLGSRGLEPAAPAPGALGGDDRGEDGIIGTFATNLSDLARTGGLDPTIGRDEEAVQAAACLLRAGQARMALVAGPGGVGKNNLFGAVAHVLLQRRATWNVMLIDLAQPFAGSAFDAEAESVLAAICDQAAGRHDVALALDHVEQVLDTRRGTLLLGRYLDTGGRIIAATLPAYVKGFLRGPLGRRIQLVRLDDMSPRQTVHVLNTRLGALAEHHGVEVDPSCVPAAIRAVADLGGHLPGKALTVIDAAAARTALTAGNIVGPDDVYFAARSLAAQQADWEDEPEGPGES